MKLDVLFIYYNQEYPELRAVRLLNIPYVLFECSHDFG